MHRDERKLKERTQEARISKRREFFSNLKRIAKADKADKARSAPRSPPK